MNKWGVNEIPDEYAVYKDIQDRTGGEIYIGVVGPVRTGKSTFIKRFMDLLVLPYMENEHEKERAKDELPQSAGGKTITTTEPKFIPKEAARIQLGTDIDVKVRLIDCVGYMVEGASGHMEENMERMVKTPWSGEEIPFTKAAEKFPLNVSPAPVVSFTITLIAGQAPFSPVLVA